MKVEIWFDGACHNKKGESTPIGYGVLMKIDGELVEQLAGSPPYLGTSNLSEWTACLMAFNMAVKRLKNERRDYKLTIYGDSQIIVNQVSGKWQIHQDTFRVFYNKVKTYTKSLKNFKIKWIRREFNDEADVLSKMGRKMYENGKNNKVQF